MLSGNRFFYEKQRIYVLCTISCNHMNIAMLCMYMRTANGTESGTHGSIVGSEREIAFARSIVVASRRRLGNRTAKSRPNGAGPY